MHEPDPKKESEERATPPQHPGAPRKEMTGRRDFLGKAGTALAAVTPVGVNVLAGAAAWTLHKYRAPATVAKLAPPTSSFIREAQFWRPTCAGVQCTLCPFECFLPDGARGLCKVRMNHGGKLVTLVYGHPVAVHIDPIEKKPVFHLLPGSRVYSVATVGCNLKCSFCQNWEISQTYPEQANKPTVAPVDLKVFRVFRGRARATLQQEATMLLSPREVVKNALKTRCQSVAYTYSEPTVFFEYLIETARLAKKRKLRNVLVSCGYANVPPLEKMAEVFDVIKIDLKGFDPKFYRRVVGGELKFVLRTLKELKRLGVFTEVVNLVVPTLNDDPKNIRAMCQWLMDNLGPDTPLFFSRFSPNYKLQNLPSTPVETLDEARNTAMEIGLHYVYLGNVPGHDGENTYCPTCKRLLIRRYGYTIMENHLNVDICPYDGTRIPGIWY